MSRRFFPLSEPKEGSRFANLRERLDAPLYAELGDNDYPGASHRSTSGQSSKAAAPAKPTANTAIAAIKPTVAPPTPPTPAEAAQIAASAAKARHKAVMAAHNVKGRERQAGELLMASCKDGSKFASADAIIAELGRLPFDNQLAAVEKHLRSKAAQRVWNRAYGIDEPKATNAAKPKSAAENVWDRAYATVAAERGLSSRPSASAEPEAATESVWDRAYAKIERARA